MKFKVARKNITPAQYRRSNRVMGATMALVYLVFALVTLVQEVEFPLPDWAFMVFYVISAVSAVYFVRKYAESKKAMFTCVGILFCVIHYWYLPIVPFA